MAPVPTWARVYESSPSDRPHTLRAWRRVRAAGRSTLRRRASARAAAPRSPRACPHCGASVPAGARFCPSCGEGLSAPSVPAGHERRLVTVLFADVTGSTALGEQLDPERLRDVMDTFFEAMREEIEAEGGTVEKFIGDAVMAAFGVPVAHEDDPVTSASSCPPSCGARLERCERGSGDRGSASRSQVRIGVNTGEVLATHRPAARRGDGDRRRRQCRGAAASRPPSRARSWRASGRSRAARASARRRWARSSCKGKAEPVSASLIVGEDGRRRARRPGPPRADGGARTRARRFSGRLRAGRRGAPPQPRHGVRRGRRRQEPADARVPRLGEAADAGRRRSFAADACPTETGHLLAARRDPQGPCGCPRYRPARPSCSSKVRTARTNAARRPMSTPDPDRAAAALAFTVGVEDPDVRRSRTWSLAGTCARVHAAWRSFFSALAARRGRSSSLIEDIHWADPALLDLLEELADRDPRTGVMFLCPSAARPHRATTRDGAAGGGTSRAWRSSRSAPMSRAIGHASCSRSTNSLRLVHARILERAEGNPFFLEEIVRHLIDEGLIVRSSASAGERASVHRRRSRSPTTSRAVLAARIDLLDAGRETHPSVRGRGGRVFWPSAVRLLVERPGVGSDGAPRQAGGPGASAGTTRLGHRRGDRIHLQTHPHPGCRIREPAPARTSASARHGRAMDRGHRRRARTRVRRALSHTTTRPRSASGRAGRRDEIRVKAFDALLRASNYARSKLRDLRRRNGWPMKRSRSRPMTWSGPPRWKRSRKRSSPNYEGDMAWRYFREAADARLSAVQGTDARACLPLREGGRDATRWPGSDAVRAPCRRGAPVHRRGDRPPARRRQ